MGKTIMGAAAVSLDGFIADDNDDVGPLFEWLGNGDVAWSFPGTDGESRTTQASADFMLSHYRNLAANVIGRRLFDLTNGWNGKPAAGEHVFVVTHQPPTDWEYADSAPFTFVDGVEKAIATAKEFAGDRDVDVAAGQIGSQALKLGLIDQVVVNVVPVVFGSGRPFFATGSLTEPLLLENPITIVRGDRVTHLVYDVVNQRAQLPFPHRQKRPTPPRLPRRLAFRSQRELHRIHTSPKRPHEDALRRLPRHRPGPLARFLHHPGLRRGGQRRDRRRGSYRGSQVPRRTGSHARVGPPSRWRTRGGGQRFRPPRDPGGHADRYPAEADRSRPGAGTHPIPGRPPRPENVVAHRPGRLPDRVGGVASRTSRRHHRSGLQLRRLRCVG
jgi:dihydrofolate reductase